VDRATIIARLAEAADLKAATAAAYERASRNHAFWQQLAGLDAPGALMRGPVAADQWPPNLVTVDTSSYEWVAPKEAASIASCSLDEIYRRCRRGEIGIRRGGRWFIRRDRLFCSADLR